MAGTVTGGAGLAWLEDQAGRLDLLCQQVRRALSEARLAAGDHLQLVPELEQLVVDHPLDEQVHAQLMVALYRCGRQADALSAYQRLRGTLAEELGIDASQPLRDLETAILRQDASLNAAVQPEPMRLSAPGAPIPAQLPPGVAGFAGRGAELDSLDAILSQVPADSTGKSPAVVITAIAGTAGVGKTALAVHWAHRVAARFPDGQLYANLRGFDSAGPAVEPGQALRGFLDALAVPPERIPASLDDQVALYRSLLAGKRMLVVLDNALDAEQVRVLLPGAPGCLAIVTSRNRLTSLIARDGAHPLGLDVLTPAGASELLTRRLGAERAGREPDAVADIITRCARLPLALTIAAARAAASPGFPLAHFAAELRDAGQSLDPFGSDDAATDVRAVFSWSYRALSTDAARLFRLLGIHPGPDITVGAAASLAGIAPALVRELLAELTRGHLLTEYRPGRYAFHDLLRAYAAEQARIHDHDGARSAAVGRLLDHCLQTAHAAATLIDPYFAPVAAPASCQPGVVIGGPATGEEALSWFTAECPTLLAVVPLAAESGSATHAWQLACALSTYLLRQGRWTDQAAACQTGLDAARRAGDAAGEGNALVLVGLGYGPSGRLDEATSLLHTALRLLETAGGWHRSRVRAHRILSWTAGEQDRHADMLSHATAALELSRQAGDPGLEVMSLNDVGYSHALLGNYRQAIGYCERSLAGSQQAGERNWESAAWDSWGTSITSSATTGGPSRAMNAPLTCAGSSATGLTRRSPLIASATSIAASATWRPRAGPGLRQCAPPMRSATPSASRSAPNSAVSTAPCLPACTASQPSARPVPDRGRRPLPARGRTQACPASQRSGRRRCASGLKLNAVSAAGANDVWAVGPVKKTGFAHTDPLAAHWDGTSWSIIPTPFTTGGSKSALFGVANLGGGNAWAVGRGETGRALTMHWNGTAWTIVSSPDPAIPTSTGVNQALNGVVAISANDVWAVGGTSDLTGFPSAKPIALHWNGTAWSVTAVSNLGNGGLSSVIASSSPA